LFKHENTEDSYVENILKREEVDVQELKKEDSTYPSPKKPAMTKPEARAKYGAVKVLDDKPKTGNFGKVDVKNDSSKGASTDKKFGSIKRLDNKGSTLPNKQFYSTKSGPPNWKDLDKIPNKPRPESKPLQWHEEMSKKHSSYIPKNHSDRKIAVEKIWEHQKSGNRGEARRLFDRFIAPINSPNPMKKSEKLEKTITAGSSAGAPSSLTGGAALAKECMEPWVEELSKPKNGKKKPKTKKIKAIKKPKNAIAKDKVKSTKSAEAENAREAVKGLVNLIKTVKVSRKEKMEDIYKNWKDKDKFLEFFASRVPHLSKKEVESIAKLAALRQFEKNEIKLASLMKSGKYDHSKVKKDSFEHHRLMAAYHGEKENHHAGVAEDFGNSSDPELKSEAEEHWDKANHHSKQGERHLRQAKKLYNKSKHGEWNKTIPNNKEGISYHRKLNKDA